MKLTPGRTFYLFNDHKYLNTPPYPGRSLKREVQFITRQFLDEAEKTNNFGLNNEWLDEQSTFRKSHNFEEKKNIFSKHILALSHLENAMNG